jgi:ubiquitin-conjugating enzyme E2 O
MLSAQSGELPGSPVAPGAQPADDAGWEELLSVATPPPPPAAAAAAPDPEPEPEPEAEEGEPRRGPAVGVFEIGTAPPPDHYYIDAPPPTGKSSKKLLRRAASEWKQLHEGLPEQITAQVFDERMDLLRVAIEGPPDTPYQHAVFVFDIHLQAGYPDVPPRVTYWAWGRRINPNLYANGKVCLSLLGTWAGPSWEPQVSTLLQVLVSIQAMILIETPYCNEPGQQGDAGTQKSLDYNAQVQADVAHSMTMLAIKPPVGLESIVAAFIAREGRSLVRMARELPNEFITDEVLVALDVALKHPLGEPVTGKAVDGEPERMPVPAWLRLAEPLEGEGAEGGEGGAGINADEEKESCATVCAAVSCSLILLLLLGVGLYFALQLALWCVWELFGMRCECEYNTLGDSLPGPLFPVESIVAATREDGQEECCTSCQMIPSCKSSMYLPEENTAALLGWLNGTAWEAGVAESGLGSFTDGPASNRISCFLVDRRGERESLKPVKVPKVAANTTWKTVATVCSPPDIDDSAAYEWSTAMISLVPLALRIVALCASMLSAAPGVQGIVLAVRACGLGAKATSTVKLGAHAAPSHDLTTSLSGGEEEMERGSSGDSLLRGGSGASLAAGTTTSATVARSSSAASVTVAGAAGTDGRSGQVDGVYVAQRAVAAVEIAEAATESAAEAAARAEWGALTGSGFGQMGYMGMEYSRPQSSWDGARLGLGLSVWEGKALSAERLLLWYWVQPVAFLWVLSDSYCGLSSELRWQSAIVALREVTFMLTTILAALPCACPGFLLLDSRLIRPSEWERRPLKKKTADTIDGATPASSDENGGSTRIPEAPAAGDATSTSTADGDAVDAEAGSSGAAAGTTLAIDGSGDGTDANADAAAPAATTDVDDENEPDDYPFGGGYKPGRDPFSQLSRAVIYLLAPHHFVTLCLIRRFGMMWALMVFLHLLADMHSLNALWLLLGEPNPMGALALGFAITVPVLFAWAAVVAWRYIEGAREVIPERPAAGRVCVGVSACVMVCAAAGVVALGVSAVLVFTGTLMPDEAACYTALRGDECVATGESLALYGASHLPERFGYTCVGSACAAQPQLGSLLSVVSCAEAAPDGYTLDVKAGRCVAP